MIPREVVPVVFAQVELLKSQDSGKEDGIP